MTTNSVIYVSAKLWCSSTGTQVEAWRAFIEQASGRRLQLALWMIVGKYSSAFRVLIVDDEPLMRWSIGETLADAGHVPILAADAREAIRAASTPPSIDIIVLDYRLPDCSGFDLLVALRCLVADAGVVMITAHDSEDFRIGAFRFGANRVLAKPLEMEKLPAIVDEVNRCRPI